MSLKVVKFGGTSMADATNITKSAEIVKSEPERRYVVVSAPGKRTKEDEKVTDLFYSCHKDLVSGGDCGETFLKIRERFTSIVADLGLKFDIKNHLDKTETEMKKYRSADFCGSRGEYLSAVVMAAVLGFEFIDASEIIIFDKKGVFDPEMTDITVKKRLKNTKNAVIPGFYGASADGKIHTFSRGGSDVTGALIARATCADVYENWTDVNGFLTADPRIVKNPDGIRVLSYRELRELAYMGANVLHPEAIFPVRNARIPINIRNTFCPEHAGTMIMPREKMTDEGRLITGIAGKKNYSIVFIEKSMMNGELGFARKVLSVFEKHSVSFEHMPSGIDTLSVVVADGEIQGKQQILSEEIKKAISPDNIEITDGFSLIATVGHGMSSKRGTASRLFSALSNAGVNVRMIDQGSSELNIIVGVSTDDYEKAVCAIYTEFFAHPLKNKEI